MADWRKEFQCLVEIIDIDLGRKILSRDELAELFGQIKAIVEREINQLQAEATFVCQFNRLAEKIYKWACEKGHWEAGEDRNNGEMITFMHSELSEAWEALRDGNPPDKHCPEFGGAEIEFADCIIRIMDTAHARKWRLAEAILAKMEFNKSRPYKHGRKI